MKDGEVGGVEIDLRWPLVAFAIVILAFAVLGLVLR